MSLWRKVAFAAALSAVAAGCGQAQPGEGAPSKVGSNLTDDSPGGLITSVGLVGLHGEKLGAYMTNHRALAKLTIRALDLAAPHHLTLGLVQKSDGTTPPDALRTCKIADWTATYGAGADGEETTVVLDKEIVIPDECLFNGSSSAVGNLWASVDALMEYEYDEAVAAGQPPPRDYNTQFFNEAAIDLNEQDRNELCVGPHGEAKCIADIRVVPSQGYNLEVSAFSITSSIGTLDKACSVDGAQPLFDANTELRFDGAPSHDGKTENEKPFNTLAQATSDPVEVSYAICPRVAGDQGGSCAPQTTWAALAIKGEDGLVAHANVTELSSDEPSEHAHPLYAEPGGAACGRINGTAVDESWLGFNTFYVRACANVPLTETRNGDGDATDDNCVVIPAQIVRAEAPDPGSDSEAASLQFNNSYAVSFGDNVANVSLNAGRVGTVNLSGATVQKSVNAALGGWFNHSLFSFWANGASNVSLTGSAGAGLSIFGNTYWSVSSASNNYQISTGPSYTASIYCMSYNLGVAGVGFNLSGCLNGTAGLTVAYDINAQNGAGPAPFTTATRNGRTHVDATPYANLSLALTASVNLAVAQGGVTGNVVLIGVSMPSNDDLRWGLTTFAGKPAMIAQASTSLKLVFNTLDGQLYAWVKVLEPRWCKVNKWFGYPCAEWVEVYNQNITSWTGWNRSLNLYSFNTTTLLQ